MRDLERIRIIHEEERPGTGGSLERVTVAHAEMYAKVKHFRSQEGPGLGSQSRANVMFTVANFPDLPAEVGFRVQFRGLSFRCYQIQYTARDRRLMCFQE